MRIDFARIDLVGVDFVRTDLVAPNRPVSDIEARLLNGEKYLGLLAVTRHVKNTKFSLAFHVRVWFQRE